jgi:hypothetical protein
MAFRRILFFLLCAIFVALLGVIFLSGSPHLTEYSVEFLYGSLLGILVWCSLFLKVEIKMARLGMVVAIIALTTLALFALVHFIGL